MSKKYYWNCLSILVAVMMSATFGACSKDETTEVAAIPEISIPIGNENFFTKGMDFESSASEKTFTFSSNVAWILSVADKQGVNNSTRSGSNWLSATPTSGEAGTHRINVKALENTTLEDRNAEITVMAGDSMRTVSVNQKQSEFTLLTDNKIEVPVEGGSISVKVISNNKNLTISIPEEYKSWIHTSKQTRGLFTFNGDFYIDKCEEYDKREGKIIVKGNEKEETISVYQVGKGILILTQNEYNISNSAQELSIEINSNFEYAVELPNVDWINEVTSRGISSHTLKLSIAENKSYDNERSAKIRIYDKNSSISEEVVINQNKKNVLQIDAKEFVFDENGGPFSVSINSNVDYKVNTDCDWITETTTRAFATTSHTFVVSAITSNSDREGTITFSDTKTGISEKVIVKQNRTIFFDISSLTLIEGSEKKINLTNKTGQGITWSSSNPSVVSVDNTGTIKALSKGNATITASTANGLHTCKCEVVVRYITDCVSMVRTGTSTSVSNNGIEYTVTFTIKNSSSETIHIVSLAGVTNRVDQDLKGGESVDITIISSTSAIQSYQQTLIYTFNGKQYSLKG